MAEERQAVRVTTALSEAQAIIDAAKRRAGEILQEAEKKFQEARQSGYEAGREQGLKDAADSAIRLMKESAKVGDVLAEQAARLALAICEKILAQQLTLQPNIVLDLAKRAIKGAIVGDHVIIVVHPDDQELLKTSENELRRVAGGASITLQADELVARGGCIVKSDFGEVDASLNALLERVSQSFGFNGSER